MRILCTNDFKSEYEKLLRNNSYSNLTKLLIDFFFIKQNFEEGTRLNNNNTPSFIKKRLGGSYRVYFYLYKIEDDLYLVYVHPKTGKFGKSNASADFLSGLLDTLKESKLNNTIYQLTCIDNKISFDMLLEEKISD